MVEVERAGLDSELGSPRTGKEGRGRGWDRVEYGRAVQRRGKDGQLSAQGQEERLTLQTAVDADRNAKGRGESVEAA